MPTQAHAEPSAPAVFCETYPSSPRCAEPLACAYCHVSTSTASPSWNPFGQALSDTLGGPLDAETFMNELPAALLAIEDLDSDGDGYSNADEIENGSLPGDDASLPYAEICPDDVTGLPYSLCQLDPVLAYRRMHLDFCGQSPSFHDLEAFRALDAEAQLTALDDALDVCLDSEHWLGKNGVLWSMAHKRVRPVGGFKAGEDAGFRQFSDYYVDYQLWVYAQIDDHDARDVVLADYFVVRSDNPTTYTAVADWPAAGGPGQPMQAERRQGMLTTQWVMFYNVMFTPIARAAAARAYTNVLGYDIANSEGLYPVAGEPADYDKKGVDAEACATCHSTLDPLTYAFRNYNGSTGGPGAPGSQYVEDRLEKLMEAGQAFANEPATLADTPEAGYLLGQPVNNLEEWATVAANSDAFARALVVDYFKTLLSRSPDPSNAGEQAELDMLVQILMTEGYSVERMLRAFVRTEAYGAP